MEKEKDTTKIKELTAQVSDWKNKYEKVKIDLRNLKGKYERLSIRQRMPLIILILWILI